MAPFSKYEGKARLVAIVWLAPILAFVLLGALNVIVYWVRPIIDVRFLINNTFIVAIAMALLVIFVLQKIYLKNNRPLGKDFHPAIGLLIPVMIIGSLVLFVMSFRYT
ncbi:MAG: hypothetical protein ING88_03930 [Cytophagales bacterium]|jgi:energy-converting hydrogenase Eha subunit A|nr:hypothetical protein [Cytophagales bacterium]